MSVRCGHKLLEREKESNNFGLLMSFVVQSCQAEDSACQLGNGKGRYTNRNAACYSWLLDNQAIGYSREILQQVPWFAFCCLDTVFNKKQWRERKRSIEDVLADCHTHVCHTCCVPLVITTHTFVVIAISLHDHLFAVCTTKRRTKMTTWPD